MEVVDLTWGQPTQHMEPFDRLGHKLYMMAKALRSWSNNIISDVRMKMHMAHDVILQLDITQESGTLSDQECTLGAKLKK